MCIFSFEKAKYIDSMKKNLQVINAISEERDKHELPLLSSVASSLLHSLLKRASRAVQLPNRSYQVSFTNVLGDCQNIAHKLFLVS